MDTFGLPPNGPQSLEDVQQRLDGQARKLVPILQSVMGQVDAAGQDLVGRQQKVVNRIHNSIQGSLRRNQSVISNTVQQLAKPVFDGLERGQKALAGAMSDPAMAEFIRAQPLPPDFVLPDPPPPLPPTVPLSTGDATQGLCPPGWRPVGGSMCCPPLVPGAILSHQPCVTPEQAWRLYLAQQGSGGSGSSAASNCTQPPPQVPTGWLGPYCPDDAPPPPPPPGYALQVLGGGWVAYAPQSAGPPPPPPPPPSPPLSPVTSYGGQGTTGGSFGGGAGQGGGIYSIQGNQSFGTRGSTGTMGSACKGPYKVPPPVDAPQFAQGYRVVRDAGGNFWICPPGVNPPSPPASPPGGGTSATQCPQSYTIVQGPPCPTYIAILGTPAQWAAGGYALPAGYSVLSVMTDTPANVQAQVNMLVQRCVNATMPAQPAQAG
jgi:hypothetical protein